MNKILKRLHRIIQEEEISTEVRTYLIEIATSLENIKCFDEGYSKGYNDAIKESCDEISENYQPK